MPVEDMVNNTKWTGRRDGGGNHSLPGARKATSDPTTFLTELPRVGATEIWEFLNMTSDAHPMHLHLVQFQLLNRQALTIDPETGEVTYLAAWAKAFPGGTFNGETADGTWGPVTYPAGTVIPGYGPPDNYFTPNADGALGGNPAFSPYLTGPVIPPNPSETGWKDTVKAFPGFVNRFVVRRARTSCRFRSPRAGTASAGSSMPSWTRARSPAGPPSSGRASSGWRSLTRTSPSTANGTARAPRGHDVRLRVATLLVRLVRRGRPGRVS